MFKFIAGIILGIVVATVGVDGVVAIAKDSVTIVQDAATGAVDAVQSRSVR